MSTWSIRASEASPSGRGSVDGSGDGVLRCWVGHCGRFNRNAPVVCRTAVQVPVTGQRTLTAKCRQPSPGRIHDVIHPARASMSLPTSGLDERLSHRSACPARRSPGPSSVDKPRRLRTKDQPAKRAYFKLACPLSSAPFLLSRRRRWRPGSGAACRTAGSTVHTPGSVLAPREVSRRVRADDRVVWRNVAFRDRSFGVDPSIPTFRR